MKRFLSMLISFVLICSFSLNVFAQDGSSSGYLTIPQYNEKYSAQTDGFLSLQEYNNKYSHGESPIIGNEVPNSQNVAPFRISPVKEQTKDGRKVNPLSARQVFACRAFSFCGAYLVERRIACLLP